MLTAGRGQTCSRNYLNKKSSWFGTFDALVRITPDNYIMGANMWPDLAYACNLRLQCVFQCSQSLRQKLNNKTLGKGEFIFLSRHFTPDSVCTNREAPKRDPDLCLNTFLRFKFRLLVTDRINDANQ